MKTKRMMLKVVSIGTVILFFAIAHAVTPPPCTSCWTNGPDCDVWKCGDGEGCCDKTCYDLATRHCCGYGNGETCADDETCCDGDCCDPEQCESCEFGTCEDSIHCSPCWEWESMPSNYIPDCPDCDNSVGCSGDFEYYFKSFSVYTGGTVAEGEIGLCQVKTKAEIVGYHVFCIEKETNVSEIIAIISAIDDISGYLDCTNCLLTQNPESCLECLFGLITDGLIEDVFPCLFIGECGSCALGTDCAPHIKKTVIDWNALDGCDICRGS